MGEELIEEEIDLSDDSEIKTADNLKRTTEEKIKPDRVAKMFGVTIQAPDGVFLKFSTLLESDVVDNPETTGDVLFKRAEAMVKMDIDRTMKKEYGEK